MYINKIKIHNFKCFKDYELSCNSQLNILVGMNDIGKTTILEAINLCLTGFFRGKYLKNNLTQDVFNNLISILHYQIVVLNYIFKMRILCY